MTKETRLHALQNQINRLQHRLKDLSYRSNHASWLRLVIFFGGVLLSGLAYFLIGVWLGAMSFAATILLFGLVVYYHRRLEQTIIRYETWIQIKSTQIARMRLDWANLPPFGPPQPRYEHPFEADLDLVGDRSMHRLLDTAVSVEGSRLLKAWLTTPRPDPQEITRRQQLVRELISMSLFRSRLMLNGMVAAGAQRMWDAGRLLSWLERPGPLPALTVWLGLFGLWAGTNLVLFTLNMLALIPPIWQVSLGFYLGATLLMSKFLGQIFHEAMALQDAIRQLGAVFGQLETFSYRNKPHLQELCRPFLNRNRPSYYLKRIGRIVTALGLRENPFIWLILSTFVPWDLYFAYRLRGCKLDMSQETPRWMSVWFELEALSSLANLAYLNPDYRLPAILPVEPQSDRPVFQAKQLGHPLIPDQERVCNDFAIDHLGEITIITGSNMSGKSTFLRTVGVNLALAYAGGPVSAQSLQTLPFRLFTAIKVSDSVTNGISYFYAEVKRLKTLLTELEGEQAFPLFFLIDEIFRGTNNRERFIGSRAYLRALVGKAGVGLVSTHDLELAKLADQSDQIKNYHFRDEVTRKRMVFNYTLHPGPCPTTNALKIMELEGLPVPVEEDEP